MVRCIRIVVAVIVIKIGDDVLSLVILLITV
jgi:hypothetical protein